MEFAEVVRRRRMVRNFADEPVAREVVDRLLDLSRHAPSAGFTQGQSFIVVTEQPLKDTIAELCGEAGYVDSGFHHFISGAPVLLIPCTSEAEYHSRYRETDKVDASGNEITWPVPYWYMDIGCAVMIVLLAAVDEGLDAGYAGVSDLAALRALLNIPDEVDPMGVIPVGHRAPDKRSPSLQRGRKADAAYVHREGW